MHSESGAFSPRIRLKISGLPQTAKPAVSETKIAAVAVRTGQGLGKCNLPGKEDLGGTLMGIMTNRSTLTGKLLVLLVAVLAAFQPGFAETQDIEEIRKAVEQGHAEAQYRLGLMYSFGQGAPQDSREAAKLIRKAAEQGHAKAQFILGFMYSTGEGVPQDYEEAVKWIRKVAEQGYALAQFSLGLKYDKGDGVPEDDREAVKWYQLAAEQGYVCAQFTLGLQVRQRRRRTGERRGGDEVVSQGR